MRILYITNMYPVADYKYFGIHVKEQIEALQIDKKIEADTYFINGRESKSNYFKSIFKIRKLISANKYDLIHIHYGISGLFMLFFRPNIPVVVTLHSGELFQKKGYINHLMQKYLTLMIVKRVNKVIVLNDAMIDLLKIYEEKLIKLPCGTNTELFNEIKSTNKAEKILIGFPGNKDRKEKNYALFANVIRLLKQDVEVETIEFHGLSRDQVVSKLSEIDLLLMTSTVEGSPQIIKEAMSCNRPVISTSVGDVSYLLEKVSNSFVINSFNAEEFVKPVEAILSLPAGSRRTNGRENLISLGLDSRSISEKLYKLYEGMLAK